MTKLCINCVHYRKVDTTFAECARTEHTNPVDGSMDYIFCINERRDYVGCCGPDAKFFEQVKTEVEA